MTDAPYLALDGSPAQSVTLYVPAIGPWFADIELVSDLPPAGANGMRTLTCGPSFSAAGTVDPDRDGGFAGEHRTRIIAGANGWGLSLDPRPYRDDAGVSAFLVASDAARDAGETLASFTGALAQLGVKYVRSAGSASRTLEDAARGASWWVDFAGLTHVGTRTAPTAADVSVQLLDFDVTLNIATLSVDDLTQISVGTTITDERLDSPVKVSAFTVKITQESLRVIAYCDGVVQSPIVDALRAIVKRASDEKLYGKYRYRVVTLEVDRVNLQSVSSVDGLPDILSVSMAPGVAGMHAKLALGAVVFVEFIAGDRADPEITGFSGRGSAGFVPQGITIGSPDDTAPLAARQGDAVQLVLPPFVASGTIAGVGAFTAVLTSAAGTLLGTITGGSTHDVKVG